MSMESPHESVKAIVGDLWRNNRPLAIALLAALAVGGYLLWKRGSAALVAPTATPDSTTSGVGSIIKNFYSTSTTTVTNPVTTVPGSPTAVPIVTATAPTVTLTAAPLKGIVPVPAPVAAPRTQIATIRNRQTQGIDAGYDKAHSGVPVRTGTNKTAAVVRLIPYGGTIALLHNAVQGSLNQNGGSTTWYPVAGGYLSAWDISVIR